MSVKKKLVLILPTMQAGGMERVMAELANYFIVKVNLEVHLVLFGKQPEIFYTLNENIQVHKNNKIGSVNSKVIQFIKTVRFIRRKILEISPDSLLAFGTHWNNLVLMSLTGTNYRIFVSDRGSPDRKYGFPHELLKSIFYKRSSGIIAQTEKAKDNLLSSFPKCNIKIIGNPIRRIESKPILTRENIILSVGRLIDSKHHDRLIKIFSQLNATDWKMIIIGGNALKQKNFDKLNRLISDLGLEERVILKGEIQNVDSYYLKSKIFAFTSSVEGFPNVIGEALSAGLPTVSYDCVAGPSEMIVNNNNGFLIPVFDDALFIKKLQLLIDNELMREQMSESAKNSINDFLISSIGDKYLEFITN